MYSEWLHQYSMAKTAADATMLADFTASNSQSYQCDEDDAPESKRLKQCN